MRLAIEVSAEQHLGDVYTRISTVFKVLGQMGI